MLSHLKMWCTAQNVYRRRLYTNWPIFMLHTQILNLRRTQERTRGNEKLKPVKVRREIGTAAIIYKGPQCYNSLPNSIIKEESTQSFKIKLKAYIIEEKLNEIL